MQVERVGLEQWADDLPDSGYEAFHAASALRVLDEHASGELRLFAVSKGQETVGLFPAFVRGYGPGRVLTSPPTGMGVPRLGPIVMPTSPKPRKRESVYREVVDELLDALDVASSRTVLRLECPLGYDDPRAFQWSDLNVGQQFTYVLDLDGKSEEEVLTAFSRDLRKEVRQATEEGSGIAVSVEGGDAAMQVYEDVRDRYAEAGDSFGADRAYFRDLVDALGDRCRTYVARDPDGEYLSGIVVLYSGDHALFWQGGVTADYDGISANSRLHWAVITDALAEDGISGYDLVGANTPRLSRYKAKFGGQLVPYYTVESSGLGTAVAKRLYATVGK
jgi:hypothetical protein